MAPNETTRTKRQPEVFTSIPNDQPTDKKPGQLSQEQLKHFFEKGYLILTDFIDHDLLRRLKLEWEGKANDLIEELYKSGKIKNKHEKEDFFHRLIQVDKEFPGKQAARSTVILLVRYFL